jgi:hypothetical protein
MPADGLVGVAIESVEEMLTHHYDPRDNVPRLSHGNYFGRSLTALGVAAHGAGHALPDGTAPALLAASVTNPRAGGRILLAPRPSRATFGPMSNEGRARGGAHHRSAICMHRRVELDWIEPLAMNTDSHYIRR